MACFLVPTGEAIVTTIMTKAFRSKEKEEALNPDTGNVKEAVEAKIPFSKKLSWLNKMLWGGSALLAFEHIWHGEAVPWFPFLTAMENADEAAAMLHEMSTVGVSMAVLVTAVWGIMVMVSKTMEKGAEKNNIPKADIRSK
ncbi:MAG: hypothetical protein K2J90_12315 [Lachnospiraceae bacterium]|nr:hypothetical protein [Lachnospiraceae bacterium]